MHRSYAITRCFWLERHDGTITDISYLECLKPSTHSEQVTHALRCAVSPDVVRAKTYLPLGCAVCRAPDGDHVDHAQPPFTVLAEHWLETVGGAAAIALEPSSDADGITRLSDDALAGAWVLFHREHALLQRLCSACNLSKGAR
jgi:hypothetical protein